MAAVDVYQPGQRVAVVQQIPLRGGAWTIRTEGIVLRYEQSKTAASFAHAKNDRLWLDRLILRHDDGEVTSYVLDQYTRVESLAASPTEESGTSSAPIPTVAAPGAVER